MFDEQLDGLAPQPQALKPTVDHEAPQEILLLDRIVAEHHETHRRVIGVYGPEPGIVRKVCLCDRHGIGCNELLLLLVYDEIADGSHRLGVDLAQCHLAGFRRCGLGLGHESSLVDGLRDRFACLLRATACVNEPGSSSDRASRSNRLVMPYNPVATTRRWSRTTTL